MNSNRHPAPAAPHTPHGSADGIAGLPGHTPAEVRRRGRFGRPVLVAAAAAAVLAGGVAAAFVSLAGPATTSLDPAAASFSSHHGPSVTSFSANHPTCKVGAGVATLKLSWTIDGAHSATVAVDGLGEYGEYTSSSLKLNIPCDGQAHVYHVWPTGSQNALKTLTVKPSYEKARS